MNARLEANLLSTGLLPLSLQRVTGMRRPVVPSNDERRQAWDALRPRERDGNAVSDWALLAQRVRAAGEVA